MATIRQHFRRQYRFTIALLVVTVLVALIVARHYAPDAWYSQPGTLGFLLASVFLPLLLVYNARVHRCPRCGSPFSKMDHERSRWNMLTDKRLFWDRFESCPNCGIRFDAEMPMGPSNPIRS